MTDATPERSDIVDQLREECSRIECEGDCGTCPSRDAADEIERLRADLAHRERAEAPEAENARLRNALVEIASPAYAYVTGDGLHGPGSPYDRGRAHAAEIAKRALSTPPEAMTVQEAALCRLDEMTDIAWRAFLASDKSEPKDEMRDAVHAVLRALTNHPDTEGERC